MSGHQFYFLNINRISNYPKFNIVNELEERYPQKIKNCSKLRAHRNVNRWIFSAMQYGGMLHVWDMLDYRET